ncbi:zinc finger protein Aiolos-like isoform X3 [Melanotaenia boesemani]|uniref:zinc finger protein Aiolos-like isoform X3 n=1 Tax=Melanotaenia boesemani TaxID=1250792 RepID=UPI001C055DF7|nr:zinc finger protein Aiolos-like isoform X3 [Melanotaenia boesemani]
MGSTRMIPLESSRNAPHPLLITAVPWLDADRLKLSVLQLSLIHVTLETSFYLRVTITTKIMHHNAAELNVIAPFLSFRRATLFLLCVMLHHFFIRQAVAIELCARGRGQNPHELCTGPCVTLDTCSGAHLKGSLQHSTRSRCVYSIFRESPVVECGIPCCESCSSFWCCAKVKITEHLLIMSTDKHPELTSLEEDGTPFSDVAEVKSQEEEEEEKENTLSENGIKCDEGLPDARVIKMEAEEAGGNEPYLEAEKEGEMVSKEEAEGGSEDGMEDRFDEERTEEDNDEERDMEGDEEGDVPNEPQDLSLVDYTRYDGAALSDDHAMAVTEEAIAEGTYMSGSSRNQTPSKLSCDICGLSCISINVLLVHKRSHTGERPFHCTQCGASFTQKGNLLRHIKLHSGEKPFKCPMCSYACRRRDALSGHLRTHSVEKPFKCNHCNRSYKQRSSLEEHRERCHVYIQSKGPTERAEDNQPSRVQMGPERALLLDRLASNVAKRKSSMPQKFTGDNGVCLDLSFNRELVHRSDVKDPPAGSPGPDGHHQQQPFLSGPDGDPPPSHRSYSIPLNRTDSSPMGLTNGHKMGLSLLGLPQPPLSMDSFHSDGSQMPNPIMYRLGHLLGGLNHQNGVPHPHTQPIPLSPREALRVMQADGEAGALPGAVYPCGHCRIIFLDYVMFTIHMGCHGFRDPLECNVCGHRSRDRYEFSSHIARGEHRLELK